MAIADLHGVITIWEVRHRSLWNLSGDRKEKPQTSEQSDFGMHAENVGSLQGLGNVHTLVFSPDSKDIQLAIGTSLGLR